MEQGHAGLFVSGNGGFSRAHKPVPKSASVHGSVRSVPPGGGGKKRMATSATTQRVPISPAICGVQPGKVLELRSTIGLMRARALLEQPVLQQSVPPTQSLSFPTDPGFESVQKAAVTRGQLKTARLQPLGIVSDFTLTPDDCLGVIPVVRPRKAGQRPRSSTTPGVHFNIQDGDVQDGRGRKVKVKRRSYSAVMARSFDTTANGQLFRLLSVSRHTALTPQRRGRSVSTPTDIATSTAAEDESRRDEEAPRGEKERFLPPVVRQGELGMRIELKGLTKTVIDSSPRSSQQLPNPSPDNGSSQESPSVPKLPLLAIPTSSPQKSPPTNPERRGSQNSLSQGQTGEGKTSMERQGEGERREDKSPRRISIVSISEGENIDNGQRPRPSRRKRHSSGSQSGRLSLGWSSPQPIAGPLKGSSLPTPVPQTGTDVTTHTEGKTPAISGKSPKGNGKGGSVMETPERVMSPSNMLCVNVNQILVEADSTDNG